MKVFTISERRILIELLSKEQINMLIVNCTNYDSDKYKALEALKIKVKDM